LQVFRERARATARRLESSLLFRKDDAVAALWRYAEDNGVIERIDRSAVEAILREAGL
jgi:hypothetical protein